MFWPSFIWPYHSTISPHAHLPQWQPFWSILKTTAALCLCLFGLVSNCTFLSVYLFSVAVSVFNCLLVAEDVLMQLSYKVRGLDLDRVIATPFCCSCPVRWLSLSEALAVRLVASHSTLVYFGTQQSSRSTQGNVPRSCACNKPKSSPPSPCWQLIRGVCGDMLV